MYSQPLNDSNQPLPVVQAQPVQQNRYFLQSNKPSKRQLKIQTKYQDRIQGFSVNNTAVQKNSVVAERKCTDVMFLVTFGLFMLVCTVLLFVALGKGVQQRLLAPVNP